jgi:hypothetical protein
MGIGAIRSRRPIAVAAVALALVVVVLRSAAGDVRSSHPLATLKPYFPGHSAIAAERSMAAIGEAARQGQAIPPSARTGLLRAAAHAPLRPEPFLAAGVEAQLAGAGTRSERLASAALKRDPRSIAARYFLAQRYVQTDRIEGALAEMAAIGRLRPSIADPLAPAIAAFARTPGAEARMRAFLASERDMRGRVFAALAADPANAALVVRLAPTLPLPRDEYGSGWAPTLVRNLVTAGEVDAAERTWTILSGHRRLGLINDPNFKRLDAPEPFGWLLGSGAGGFAEFAPGGGLSIVYYGRETAELAKQLLILPPGRYRVRSTLAAGSAPGNVQWVVTCADNRDIASVAVGKAADIAIPATCRSASLRLVGMPNSPSTTVDFRLQSVDIARLSGTANS